MRKLHARGATARAHTCLGLLVPSGRQSQRLRWRCYLGSHLTRAAEYIFDNRGGEVEGRNFTEWFINECANSFASSMSPQAVWNDWTGP